jgi:hypothetical protein
LKFVSGDEPQDEEEGRGDIFDDENASGEESENLVVVAYTSEDFGGATWKISEPGEYDLRGGFGLPNDSIQSLRVKPGYQVTLYEHSEFAGESESFDEDAYSLYEWARQASSLKVEKIGDEADEVAQEWLSEANEPGEFTQSDLDEEDFASALEERAAVIANFDRFYEQHWHGEYTDEGRVDTSGKVLKAFEALGYDVSDWEPDTFTQAVGNFLDWRNELSLLQAACLVLNVDYAAFE